MLQITLTWLTSPERIHSSAYGSAIHGPPYPIVLAFDFKPAQFPWRVGFRFVPRLLGKSDGLFERPALKDAVRRH